MAAVQTEERSALLDLLRSQMLKAPRPSLLPALMNLDRQWIVAHSVAIAQRNPAAVLGLILTAAREPTNLVEFVETLLPHVTDRLQLVAELNVRLVHPQKAALLERLNR
jgi:hypothetical protein